MNLLIFSLALIGLIVTTLLLFKFWLISHKPLLTTQEQNKLGGTYLTLSHGVIHYELTNISKDAPIVVLFHGITVPMVIWEKTIYDLQRAGISTLRFDYLGRGRSDRPKAPYSARFFAEVSAELIDKLLATQPIHLIGNSLGGAVASYYTLTHPKRVLSLTLIDTAISLEKKWYDRYKNAYYRFINSLNIARNTISDIQKKEIEFFTPSLKEQFSYQGVEQSLFSMFFHDHVTRYTALYHNLAALSPCPIHLMWGEKDTLFPLYQGEWLAEILNPEKFSIIKDGTHTPHVSFPEITNPLLIDFIQQQTSPSCPSPSKRGMIH